MAQQPVAAYLLAGAYAGFASQRWSALKTAITAETLNLTWVLPSWQLEYFDPLGTAEVVSFSYFYDPAPLLERAHQRGARVADTLPPDLFPRCIAQLSHHRKACPAGQSFESALRAAANRSSIVCLSGECAFRHTLQGWSQAAMLAAYRPALVPARPFVAEVEAVLEAVRGLYNTTDFVSVHVRIEEDFQAACGGSVYKTHGLKCFVSEDEIARYMLPHVAPGSLVFVASGAGKRAMPTLCSQYHCWKRADARRWLPNSMVRKPTTHAFLDFLIALRGRRFFGNRFSVFSKELAVEFQQRTLPAEFYNAPLQRSSGLMRPRGHQQQR